MGSRERRRKYKDKRKCIAMQCKVLLPYLPVFAAAEKISVQLNT